MVVKINRKPIKVTEEEQKSTIFIIVETVGTFLLFLCIASMFDMLAVTFAGHSIASGWIKTVLDFVRGVIV